MLHDQKVEKILELLETRPYWTSIDLSQKLNASRSTIQRCLQELHDAGLAERIHGGVKRLDRRLSAPITVEKRVEEDAQAKDVIANSAIKLLPESGYIYLDAGTSLWPLAQKLNANSQSRLKFITNDVAIASILALKNIPHILIGGQLHPVTKTLSGPISQDQITQFNFELCFISVNGIDVEGNVTCSVIEEAMLKRQAIKQSARKVLLAASSKWNKQAASKVADLNEFDVWICEQILAEIKKICKKNSVLLQ
jgi:DeoR family fructose operon transcriptional repressor